MTSRHLLWLSQANAAEYPCKKLMFYPLKSRLCRRFGVADGFDLQVIEYACWGIREWEPCNAKTRKVGEPPCQKCGGTGIYNRRKVVLQRWLINGKLFHEPVFTVFPWQVEITETITGLIRHEPVASGTGYRAMMRLLLRYEPKLWAREWMDRVQRWANTKSYPCRVGFARLRRVFQKAHPNEEVPF